MKSFSFLTSAAALFFVACQSPKPHPLIIIDAHSIVHQGIGVDNLQLDHLTKKALIKIFTEQHYDSINHNGYSVELHYPTFGVSFYYDIKDDSQKIFAMDFDTAFKGTTKRGFNIRTMTVRDVIHLYGEPTYQLLPQDGLLYAHFDTTGIYFVINPKTGEGGEFVDTTEHPDEGETDETEYDAAARKFYDSVYI